jgi:hypothetical protein
VGEGGIVHTMPNRFTISVLQRNDMKIFGKTVADHIRFQILFLILIATVELARLGFSLAGVANSRIQ